MRSPVHAARVGGCAAVLAVAVLASALPAAPALAQPWRASVLALPGPAAVPADSAAASALPAPAPPPAPSAERPPAAPRLEAPPLEAQPAVRQPPILFPILLGTTFATVGAIAGANIGNSLDESNSEFIPVGAAFGFLVGEAVLLPVGVHLGNARRGRIAPDVGASLLGAIAALGVGALTNSAGGYLVGVGGQIGLTVWAERDAARRKQSEADEAARRLRERGIGIPGPPPEPDPLVPPPPPTK